MSNKKTFSTVLAPGAVAVAGATAALAIAFYRRPIAMVSGVARLRLQALGAREGISEAGGLSMHYYCMGRRGEPVVLLHGLGGSAEAYAMLMPLLSREFLVYAPDMPGFGRTPLAPGKQCIAMHARYLGHFLDALGYPQVTLVGQSFGGWIATRYAAEHPERVTRLYLLNSAGLRREGMFSPYTPDRATAKRYIGHVRGYRGPLPQFLLDARIRVSQAPAYAGFIANYDRAEEVDALLPHIRVPTTIFWGLEDRIFPLRCAHDFHQGIPNSRLVLAPGVSHNSHVKGARSISQLMLEDRKS